MKIRSNYVSNSSSASFVVFNWFDLPEEKRDYIKNYDENAFEVWRKKKIKFETYKNEEGYSSNPPLYGKEYSYLYENKKEKYDFGFINDRCRWHFKENKDKNTCVVDCSMDNFFMENWLKYNNVDFEEEDFI